MNRPPVAFYKTRRLGVVLIASLSFTVLFLSFYTNSYAMPSFNFAWETPISYFLGPILGSLLVLVAHSVSPEIEILSVAPIRFYRALVAIGISITQFILIFVGMWFANSFVLTVPISDGESAGLIASTIAFQGLGMFSGALFPSFKAWIIPVAAFFACVGFGFNADTTVRPHHILVTTSATTSIIACCFWAVGLIALLVIRQRKP